MKKKSKPQSTELRLKSVENRVDLLEQIVRNYQPRITSTWIDPRIQVETRENEIRQ